MLCFRKLLVAKKFLDKKEGGVSKFRLKIFRLKMPKNFVGEPSRLSLSSSIEKIYASQSYVTIFRRNFFVSKCRRNS